MCQTAWSLWENWLERQDTVCVCVCVCWRGARRNELDEKLQQLVGHRVMSHNYFSTLGVKTERASESQGNKADTQTYTFYVLARSPILPFSVNHSTTVTLSHTSKHTQSHTQSENSPTANSEIPLSVTALAGPSTGSSDWPLVIRIAIWSQKEA